MASDTSSSDGSNDLLAAEYMVLYSGKFLYGANFHMRALYAKIKTTKIKM